MATEKHIKDDARQCFTIMKLKRLTDYETTYHHLREELEQRLEQYHAAHSGHDMK